MIITFACSNLKVPYQLEHKSIIFLFNLLRAVFALFHFMFGLPKPDYLSFFTETYFMLNKQPLNKILLLTIIPLKI